MYSTLLYGLPRVPHGTDQIMLPQCLTGNYCLPLNRFLADGGKAANLKLNMRIPNIPTHRHANPRASVTSLHCVLGTSMPAMNGNDAALGSFYVPFTHTLLINYSPPPSAISLSRFLALLILSVISIATPQAGSITTQRDALSFSHCIRKKRVAMPNLISASFRGDVACAALIFKIRKTNMLIRAEFQNI